MFFFCLSWLVYNVFSLTDLLFHSLSMNLLLFNMEFLPKTRRNIIPIFLRISHTLCTFSFSGVLWWAGVGKVSELGAVVWAGAVLGAGADLSRRIFISVTRKNVRFWCMKGHVFFKCGEWKWLWVPCHDTYDIESEMKKRVRKLSINYKPAKIYIDSMIILTS